MYSESPHTPDTFLNCKQLSSPVSASSRTLLCADQHHHNSPTHNSCACGIVRASTAGLPRANLFLTGAIRGLRGPACCASLTDAQRLLATAPKTVVKSRFLCDTIRSRAKPLRYRLPRIQRPEQLRLWQWILQGSETSMPVSDVHQVSVSNPAATQLA